MTNKVNDKIKLQSIIHNLYMSPQHFENPEATECEIEIRKKLESFKIWANNLIEEKINK